MSDFLQSAVRRDEPHFWTHKKSWHYDEIALSACYLVLLSKVRILEPQRQNACLRFFADAAKVRILEPQRQNGMSDFCRVLDLRASETGMACQIFCRVLILQSAGACATGTSEARRASLLDAQKIVAYDEICTQRMHLVLLSKVRILEPQRQNACQIFQSAAHCIMLLNEDLRASETECMSDFLQSAVRRDEPHFWTHKKSWHYDEFALSALLSSLSKVRILEPQRQNGMSDFLQSAVRILEPQRQNGMSDFLQSAVRILEPQRQNGMSDFSQSAGARTTGTSEARRASLLDAKKIVSL
ncbi:hypothetical protein BJ912DRAFT_938417 [Pholiota molesta]|nr:hypothetical protein BJ912DRAFT_938417 [Pholiota molesta]